MRFRHITLSLAAVMLAVVAAGCSSEHKAAGRSKELFELKVPTSTSISNLVVAEQKGFMAEEGLKIKEVGVLALSMYYPALIRGDIDIAGGHPDGLARAIMGGVKIKGIAPGIVDHPQFQHQLYLVKADSRHLNFKYSLNQPIVRCSPAYQ